MQTTRSIFVTACSVLAVFALSGCSFLVTSSPDPTTPHQTCVTSKAPVMVDVVTAVLIGSMSIAAFTAAGRGDDESSLMPVIGLGTAIPTGVAIGSAVYGNRRTNQCAAAQR